MNLAPVKVALDNAWTAIVAFFTAHPAVAAALGGFVVGFLFHMMLS